MEKIKVRPKKKARKEVGEKKIDRTSWSRVKALKLY
jgi:hypothetical protein